MAKTFLGITCVIAGLAIGWLGSAYYAPAPEAGGVYNQVSNTFNEGLVAGKSGQFLVDTNGALTTGGTVLSTSTSGTLFGALSAAQLKANATIVLTPNVNSATTTLPTAALFAATFPTVGQTRTWILINGTSTASKTVGIAAGSSMDLDANTLNNVQIAPNASAALTCITISSSSVRCRVNVLAVGD